MMQAETAHARRFDPSTSHRAAKAVTPEITRIQQQVMWFARKRGVLGFTDTDLEEAMQDHGSTFRTRRRELTDKGLIRDSGQRHRAVGDARERIVWIVA